MRERVELGIEAIRRLNPHPNRHARYVPGRRAYVQVGRAATDEEIEEHLRGFSLLGAVSADDGGTTNSVGLDLDAHTSDQKPLACAKCFASVCRAVDVPIVVHTSKSSNGVHVRTLFKEPVQSWLARALFISLSVASGIDGSKALDKVWPPSRGFGVLALPYQARYAKACGGTLPLDPHSLATLPKGMQLEAVTEAAELDQSDVEGVLNFLGVKTEEHAKAISGYVQRVPGNVVSDGVDGGLRDMVERCHAVKRLQDEASTVKYDFWFGMMTNFKPFWGGKELFRAFSELDHARWDEKAFDRSWAAITGKPRNCENLEAGWACPALRTCKAKSPAGLPFALRRH